MAMLGGTSDINKTDFISDFLGVDDEVKAILEEIKLELHAETGTTRFCEFEIHSYKTQDVAGTNYFIKCSAAGKFVHVRAYKVCH